MEIITQNYENILKDLIIKNFSDILTSNIYTNDSKNRVFNYIDILSNLDSKLCEIACKSLKAIFDAIDRGFKNSPERRRKYHIKSHQERTILTVFGEITFRRTFYSHKRNYSSYCYLDDYLGLKKYDYFDPYIKSTILEQAAILNSYSKVARFVNNMLGNRIKFNYDPFLISKQTIRNIILSSYVSNPQIIQKDTPDTIYIMADEKFIATQNHNNEDVMVKSIVIFDGKNALGKRVILNNKNVFASFGNNNCLDNALDFLYYTYDTDVIKNIFIMGDGASWIKNLRSNFRINNKTNVIFALDKFHFKQAIHHIALHSELEKILTYYVLNNMKADFSICCDALISSSPHRSETISNKQTYIINNWNYINNLYEFQLSCPMESQISHNIADIFSSRPKGYSIKSLNNLLNLRLLYLNHHNIKLLFLNNFNKKDILTFNKEHLNFDIFDKYKLYTSPQHPLLFPKSIYF